MAQPLLKTDTNRRHLRNNAWSMVLFSAVLCCFSFGIGEKNYSLLGIALVCCSVSYALLVDRLNSKSAAVGLYATLSAFWIVSQLVLPFGPMRISALLPILIFAVSISKTGLQAYFPIIGFIGATALLNFSGIVPDVEVFMPAWLSVSLVFSISFYLTVYQLSHACDRYDTFLAHIVDMESQLLKEKGELSQKLDLLKQANEIYKQENDKLAHQVLKEAKLTSSLMSSRAEASEMANAIHHDLREPLRSIVSFSQLIRRRLANAGIQSQVDDYLAYAEDGGQRMAKMLNDLMSYTRTDDEEISMRPVDLNTIVSDVVLNLRDLIERNEATVDVDRLPAVYGQPTQLIQLFQNIISNALKFVKDGVKPYIHVRFRVDENGKHVIEIQDNGIGIAEKDLDKVFGLFNRVHGSQAYEGSGVGLSLCKRIALSHGAELKVRSKLGEGTTFILCFSEYHSVEGTVVQDIEYQSSTILV